MILLLLVLIPLAGGLAAFLAGVRSRRLPRWIALSSLVADLALAVAVWARGAAPPAGGWIEELKWQWAVQAGVSFHLALDGLSLLLVLLTAFLGILAVAASWTEIEERVGFFHLNLLWVLAGVIGVFTALDLFLFYFFWELMLVPMYFLIGIWGHQNRNYAAIKFFVYTQAGGLFMLVAILALYFVHGKATGVYSFDYRDLLGTRLPRPAGFWIMLGFFIAFAVKLPAVPFHGWLPDAHTEAPTAGSVVLAGLLLKTGAYGILRFVLPLFPAEAREFAPVAMWMGVAGILYGAVMALAQTDLKRLVAYTSVSHLGFVLVGAFAGNRLALQGAVMQMICHGVSTGALFILVGGLQERIHTRDLRVLGGLWKAAPRMGAVGLLFTLASLGLPGLGNFIAEFLILLGAWPVNPAVTATAALGLVASAVYSLVMFDSTFHGSPRTALAPRDLSARDLAMFAALILAIAWLGLAPQPFLETARPALEGLLKAAAG